MQINHNNIIKILISKLYINYFLIFSERVPSRSHACPRGPTRSLAFLCVPSYENNFENIIIIKCIYAIKVLIYTNYVN